MKLEIQTIWSPDLNPPSDGLPSDIEEFDVFLQVSLGDSGKPGGEVFSFSVSSPSALSQVNPNRFISHTLVLERFEWKDIRTSIEKLLRHTDSCTNWNEVIKSLSGYLKYSDE